LLILKNVMSLTAESCTIHGAIFGFFCVLGVRPASGGCAEMARRWARNARLNRLRLAQSGRRSSSRRAKASIQFIDFAA
jgi:hypothetical protein